MTSSDKRWKEQRLCHKLDREIQQLQIALGELDTVKPKKDIYMKKASIFFLGPRDVIVESKKNEKEKKRHDLRHLLRKLE